MDALLAGATGSTVAKEYPKPLKSLERSTSKLKAFLDKNSQEALLKERDELQQSCQQLIQEHDVMLAECKQLNGELDRLRAQLANAAPTVPKAQFDALQKERNNMVNENKGLKDDNECLRKDRERQGEEIERLREQLAKLRAEKSENGAGKAKKKRK